MRAPSRVADSFGSRSRTPPGSGITVNSGFFFLMTRRPPRNEGNDEQPGRAVARDTAHPRPGRFRSEPTGPTRLMVVKGHAGEHISPYRRALAGHRPSSSRSTAGNR